MSAVPIHVDDASIVVSTVRSEDRAEFVAMGFLARYRIKTTRDSYALALRQWFGWCAEHFVDPLAAKRAHIEIFARELESTGRQLATVAGKLTALAGFYKYALADEFIDRDPMLHVKRPSIQRESTTLGLTRPEFADMLNAAEAASLQDHALICILGLNGLRVSEALGIDLEHLGRHKGQATADIIRKYGNRQTIPFAPRTAWAVEQLKGDRQTGALFRTSLGNRMDRKGAGRVVKRLALSCGITKRIHPHSLRHTFVTLSRDAGIADCDIISSTGHSDSRMVSYYDRKRNNIERSATHGLAAFVERAT